MSDTPEQYFSEEHRRWLVSMIPKCLAEAKYNKLTYTDLLWALYEKGFVYPFDDIGEVLTETIRGDDRVFLGVENGKRVFYLHKGKYDPEAEEDPPTPELYRILPEDNPETD